MTKLSALTLALLGTSTLALLGCSTTNDIDSKPISLQILYTNDHHSYLEGQSYSLTLDYDHTHAGAEEVQLNLGGFSRIASAIDEYRDEDTLVLNNGELNGTLYFSLFHGEPDFKVFNYLGLDAYQLGNHEFDEGDAHLAQLMKTATFPIITSNIHPTKKSALYGAGIKPYIIKEVDGEKVAVLGVLKVEKTKESSMISDDVEFSDEIETTRQYVTKLAEQGVNKIILLSHLGYDFDKLLASQVDGVDIILGGDTHNILDSTGELASMGLSVDGDGPTVVDSPSGKPVYIMQAWEYAKGIGRMQISFDQEGYVSDINSKLELLVGKPYQVRNGKGELVPATEEQEEAISDVISHMDSIREIEKNDAVEAIIQPYKERILSYRTEDLGMVSTTMSFTRFPTNFAAGETPTGSYAAQIVTDAQMAYVPQADVAIQNAGGVRAEFTEGTFSVGDAYSIQPFSNTIVTVKMSGEQVVKVLNEALSYAQGVSGSTGAFPYASHLRYNVTFGAPEQQGITGVEVKDRDTGTWSDIDLDKIYLVATNSFTATGKDGYTTFSDVIKADPSVYRNTNVAYTIPLIEYFRDELKDNTLPALNPEDYSIKSVTGNQDNVSSMN